MIIIPNPKTGEYPEYYDKYFTLLNPEIPVLTQLYNDSEYFARFIADIPAEKLFYAYAPEKWTTASVIQHIIDTERILAYRILCFARGEQLSLPGFDENAYAKQADMQHKNTQLLSMEWMTVRQATFSLLVGLTEHEINCVGNANNTKVSVPSLVYMIATHARHHFNVIHERYL